MAEQPAGGLFCVFDFGFDFGTQPGVVADFVGGHLLVAKGWSSLSGARRLAGSEWGCSRDYHPLWDDFCHSKCWTFGNRRKHWYCKSGECNKHVRRKLPREWLGTKCE